MLKKKKKEISKRKQEGLIKWEKFRNVLQNYHIRGKTKSKTVMYCTILGP